jgi:hypothetical protein
MAYQSGSRLISYCRLLCERPERKLFGRSLFAFYRALKRATTRAVLRENAVDIGFVGRFSVNLYLFYRLEGYK